MPHAGTEAADSVLPRGGPPADEPDRAGLAQPCCAQGSAGFFSALLRVLASCKPAQAPGLGTRRSAAEAERPLLAVA